MRFKTGWRELQVHAAFIVECCVIFKLSNLGLDKYWESILKYWMCTELRKSTISIGSQPVPSFRQYDVNSSFFFNSQKKITNFIPALTFRKQNAQICTKKPIF